MNFRTGGAQGSYDNYGGSKGQVRCFLWKMKKNLNSEQKDVLVCLLTTLNVNV